VTDATTPPTLRPPEEYVDAVRTETAALIAAAEAAGADAPVPSCPEWTVSDLLAHIGRVQNWAASVVERRTTEPVRFRDLEKPPEDAAGRLAYAREVGARLADALGSVAPGTPIWTFATDGYGVGTAGFWQRRQAHEAAVHRYDAQLAAGSPAPVDMDRAADGIDELLTIMGPRAFAEGLAGPTATLHLHCTDRDGEWLVRLTDHGYEVERAHAKGDVAVRGPASDLFLLASNRRGLDGLEVFGDEAVLARWRDGARL
jgi:uncharacterized protein (TIGR03083 family)